MVLFGNPFQNYFPRPIFPTESLEEFRGSNTVSSCTERRAPDGGCVVSLVDYVFLSKHLTRAHLSEPNHLRLRFCVRCKTSTALTVLCPQLSCFGTTLPHFWPKQLSEFLFFIVALRRRNLFPDSSSFKLSFLHKIHKHGLFVLLIHCLIALKYFLGERKTHFVRVAVGPVLKKWKTFEESYRFLLILLFYAL